jgi:putative membrane protein (TIGR04086 family)
MQMLKCLLASYIVTGLLLLGLTFLVYKFELDEQVVLGSIVAIYVVSTFVGGFIIGKLMGKRKFLWGMMLGFAYFALLLLISYGVYREFNTNGLNVITTVLLCVGGGMLGGMLS